MSLRSCSLAGPASGSSMTVVARSGQSLRTKSWAKILSAEAGQSPKKHSSEAITGVPANILSEPGPSDSRSAGLGKQAAGLSPSNEGASGHFMSPKGKIRRAPGVVPKPAKQHQTTRTKQTSRKTTSSKRPVNMTAPGIARDETDEGDSHLPCLLTYLFAWSGMESHRTLDVCREKFCRQPQGFTICCL